MSEPENTPTRCPRCGEPLPDQANFCEACGHDVSVATDALVASSLNPPDACTSCGSAVFAPQPDGGVYCDNCGVRRPTGREHAEADLGPVAAASDIGLRHHQNEDGYAILRLPSAYAGVVCDGVSSSSRPDTASHPAALAAVRTILRVLGDGEPDAASAEAATVAATGAAQAAAVDAAGTADLDPAPGHRRANPPSTTYVSAVVTPDAVTIGWIGDSRAYWLGDDGTSACLTVDDTLGGQLAAAGVPMSDDAPNAGALLRWLGADASELSPHVAAFQPASPGRVIVCSDGLYRYAPEPTDLAAITPAVAAADTVRALVTFALDAGGGDNVTVIVLPFPPPTTPKEATP
jgi:serine/threonine protein phosphatase PrpC